MRIRLLLRVGRVVVKIALRLRFRADSLDLELVSCSVVSPSRTAARSWLRSAA
eukprot:SAG11_NODE_26526_length_344_cov_0.632653_1_plen_52_part_01